MNLEEALCKWLRQWWWCHGWMDSHIYLTCLHFFSLIHISFTSFFTSFNDDDDHHHRGLGRCSFSRRHTCTNHQEIFAWVVLSTFFFHSWRYFLFLFFLYFYGMKKLKRKKRKESRKILPNDQRNQSNFY